MKCRVGRVFAAALTLALAAVAASGAAGESAKAHPSAGSSTITHAGQTAKVTDATQIVEGDIVRVAENSRLTVEYGDESTLAIVGPAALRFGQIDAKGRRLVLASGTISEAKIYGIAAEIQAPNPYDASMVLQNARGFARYSPGDRVTFERLEGNFAKVWRDNKYTDLGANAWTLHTRDNTVTTEPATAGVQRGPRRGVGKEEVVGTDTVRVFVGDHDIVFHPASGFAREQTADGGLRLTFQGGGDSWGVIEDGLETTLFVASGESVDFADNGDVTRFNGVAHEYGRLFAPIMWDQPIENAIDASPEFPHNH
jgi:hypothetical protein